jgi:hypothetical protein
MLPTNFQFIWLMGFRRLKCEKLTDDRQQTTDAKSPHCLWQSELKRARFVMIHYQTWPPQAILVSD